MGNELRKPMIETDQFWSTATDARMEAGHKCLKFFPTVAKIWQLFLFPNMYKYLHFLPVGMCLYKESFVFIFLISFSFSMVTNRERGRQGQEGPPCPAAGHQQDRKNQILLLWMVVNYICAHKQARTRACTQTWFRCYTSTCLWDEEDPRMPYNWATRIWDILL